MKLESLKNYKKLNKANMRNVVGGDSDSTKVKPIVQLECVDTQYYCYRSSAGSTSTKTVIDQSTDTSQDCY